MKKRLIDRLPPGALAEFDKMLESADHRRSTHRRRRDNPNTTRQYKTKFQDYQRWCTANGYQTDALFITDARVDQYVRYLVGPTRRAAPDSVKQAIGALKEYAEAAGVEPVPSGRAACAVLKSYKAQLKAGGYI